jgi:hypothetical protein
MVASYIRDFDRAVAELERVKSALSVQSSGASDLNTLNALNTPLSESFSALERQCPPYIEASRWKQCVADGPVWDGPPLAPPTWRDQTEEEQRRIYDEVGMATFKEVRPYWDEKEIG